MIVALLLACSTSPDPVATPIAAPAPDVVTRDDSECGGPLACGKACESGEALACNRLGLMVHDGRSGAPRNPSEAAAHYREACDLGAGIGCYNLSAMLRTGDGVPKDTSEAERLLARTHSLYEKSCAAGGLTWCTNLAGLVQRGEGRDPDQTHARNLYMDTCERGDSIACLELAYMVREGHGGSPDPEAAAALLRRTCDGGSGPACNNLGLWVEQQGDDPVPLFVQACEKGVPMGCRNLAVRSPESERLPLLSKACDAAVDLDPVACAIAAQMLLQQTPPDPQKAGAYLVRACSVGLAEACVPAVQLAAEGKFRLMPREARGLLDRACALGDQAACEIVSATQEPPAP